MIGKTYEFIVDYQTSSVHPFKIIINNNGPINILIIKDLKITINPNTIYIYKCNILACLVIYLYIIKRNKYNK